MKLLLSPRCFASPTAGAALAVLSCLSPSALYAKAPAAQAASLPVVTVGVFTVAPYVIAGPDGPGGALIDFFDQEIAPRMGVRFKWERPMTTARLEQSLINGRVMFTPILVRTRQRVQAGIRFAGDSHIRFTPCLAVMPAFSLDAVKSPADLANMKVGWVQAGALPEFMLDKRIRLDRVGSVEWTAANLEKLRLGRIDAAYFSNHYTPQYFAVRTGLRLKLLTLPTKSLQLQAAFGTTVSKSLIERYRRAAEEAFAGDRLDSYVHRALVADLAPLPRQ